MAVNAEISNRLVDDLRRDFGFTLEGAIGFVGNLAQESGGFNTLQEKDPLIPGSKGGYGYAQWTGPRRKAFEAYVKANSLDPTSYEANYGFLSKELNTKEYASLINRLQDTNSIEYATLSVSDIYLNPGIKNEKSRREYSNLVQNAYSDVGTKLDTGQISNLGNVPVYPSASPPRLPFPLPASARPQGQGTIAPAGLSPRLTDTNVVVNGGMTQPFTANDYANFSNSMFQPSRVTPTGSPYTLKALAQRSMIPNSLADFPAGYLTGTGGVPPTQAVRPALPVSSMPAYAPRPMQAVRPALPVSPMPAYAPRPTQAVRPVLPVSPMPVAPRTQTVRRDGTTSNIVGGANQAGTVAMPSGYRPILNAIPQSNTYGAGISFPSGLNIPAKPKPIPLTGFGGMTGLSSPAPKPTTTPLTGYGGMTGVSSLAPLPKPAPLSFPPIAPKPNPLTGFGGMTGTYTPPVAAKPAATTTQPKATSSGSSGSSGSTSSAPATFKGSSTGTTYTVGKLYTSAGNTYKAMPNGTFQKV